MPADEGVHRLVVPDGDLQHPLLQHHIAHPQLIRELRLRPARAGPAAQHSFGAGPRLGAVTDCVREEGRRPAARAASA